MLGALTAGDSSWGNMILQPGGNVGIGTTGPNTALDLSGAFSQRGMAAPAVSVAAQGRIYYDSTLNKFRVSQNNGAYMDLVSTSAGDLINGGNTTGAAVTVGTNDANSLALETGGTTRMTIKLTAGDAVAIVYLSGSGNNYIDCDYNRTSPFKTSLHSSTHPTWPDCVRGKKSCLRCFILESERMGSLPVRG